jgi:membrane protease subunit HflK
MQDAEPPTEAVKTAFNAVENAKQNKDTEINSANKYQREQLAAADAEVNNILRSAEAQKTERTNEASRAVVLFNAMYDEYAKNPDATALRLYYEALIKVLPNLKVVVGAGSNAEQILPLDSFTK